MTRQKAQDIRKLDSEALRALVQAQHAKLVELVVKKHVSGIKNVRETKEIKKHIARALTILHERTK
jgi:ribosomal protein L29